MFDPSCHAPERVPLFIERMDLNEELFTDSMSKPDVRALITSFLGNLVSKKLADQEIEYSRIIEPSIQQVFLLDLGVRFTNDRGAGVKSAPIRKEVRSGCCSEHLSKPTPGGASRAARSADGSHRELVPPQSGKLSPVLLTTRGLKEMTSAALQRGCQS